MILVQLNTNRSAEMFPPAGLEIKVGQKVNKCFLPCFFCYQLHEMTTKESQERDISYPGGGGVGGDL